MFKVRSKPSNSVILWFYDIMSVPDTSQPLSSAPVCSPTFLPARKKVLLSTLDHTRQCGN